MPHKHKILALGAAIVLLFALGVSQLQAQSPITLESLSSRITALTRRISTLSANKADKSQVSALEDRVATLEARLRATTPTPTSTPPPPTAPATLTPTATPTPTPTATPTPATPYVTTAGRMNIRRGPGTNYAIVATAAAGEQFDITGKNPASDWWRIDYQGQNAWIYAPFVTATNAAQIPVVPTPAPPPTPIPQPTPTQIPARNIENPALYLIEMDRQTSALQQEWNALSQEDKDGLVITNDVLLSATAEYCNMSKADAAALINRHGQVLDDAGYAARNDVRVRSTLMLMLNVFEEAAHTASGCDAWLAQAIRDQLANE